MKKYILGTGISLCLLMSSCLNDSFLEVYPKGQQTEATVFTTYDNFKTYAWGLYNVFFGYTYDTGQTDEIFRGDFESDNMIKGLSGYEGQWAYQKAKATDEAKEWDYDYIRRVNLMLDNIDGSQMNDTEKEHWRSVGYFFRSYKYFQMLSRFGDIPWVENALKEGSPELYGKRDSRDLVASNILSNLKYAETHIGADDGKNTIGISVVQALISRFALFEGTWRKYHGLSDAETYLKECVRASEEVLKVYPNVHPQYDELFNSESLDGVTGIILYKAYETGQLMHGLTRMVRTGESYIEATKDAVDSYLCTDGRPVSTTTSRYGGDKEIYGQFRDRDYRLYLTICPPYMVKKENGPSTADWKYTDDAQDREFIDLLATISGETYHRLPSSNFKGFTVQGQPHFKNQNWGQGWNASQMGFWVWKYYNTHTVATNANGVNTTDAPLFRVGEVMVNYAEAMCELGKFDQTAADKSINKLRARGHVAKMTVEDITDDFINRRHIGEHCGGYGAFVFEITGEVNYGKENSILVRVNNGEQLDVMPLVGDFNFYGGIYRDVHLLITDEACISPLNYASPGVRLIQDSVSHQYAKVRAVVDLANGNNAGQEVELGVRLLDGQKVVAEQKQTLSLAGNAALQQELTLEINNPHLWNGRQDPFLYQAEVSLSRGGQLVDCVTQPLGLRFYRIDPDKGFFLNGKHLPLHGVCRHQDRSEVGNALRPQHHEEDAALMLEMGVNAVRLAHYPQATYFYDLMDKNGIIVWAEIPFIGPGGYDDKGFVNLPSFRANGKEQLKELIRQHFNHPSICVWGLFNELLESGDNPVEYIKELNELAHQEDAIRPTTSASNQMGALNFITDAIAWNRYDGWYGGTPADLGRWLDGMHRDHPEIRIAISEYGAGASIYHQQDSLVKSVPNSWWHPENWQTYYHIENWKAISSRPYIWGSFVWNMFDFGAAHRTEGDRPGINDKGLVTFDRKVCKDAFYFYKANWNKEEPVLYLAGKRNTVRSRRLQTITAFTNQPGAELFVNGKSYGKAMPDQYATLEWKNVELQPGENEIKVVSINKKIKLTDSFRCKL